MRKYINAAMSLTSVGLLFYIIFHQKEENKVLKAETNRIVVATDSLQKVVDSLQNEVFIQSTSTTRYEVALDRLKEQHPEAATQFEEQLSNTE